MVKAIFNAFDRHLLLQIMKDEVDYQLTIHFVAGGRDNLVKFVTICHHAGFKNHEIF